MIKLTDKEYKRLMADVKRLMTTFSKIVKPKLEEIDDEDAANDALVMLYMDLMLDMGLSIDYALETSVAINKEFYR